MAIEITRKYPGREGKNQILEWYLNYNFYGNAAYGIEAAANVYYNKPVKDLALDEIAVLAAIPQYPGSEPVPVPRRCLPPPAQGAGLHGRGRLSDTGTGGRGHALLQHAAAQRSGGARAAERGRSAPRGDRRPARHRPRAQRAGQGRPDQPGRGGRGQEAARSAVAIHARIGPGTLRDPARCATLRHPGAAAAPREVQHAGSPLLYLGERPQSLYDPRLGLADLRRVRGAQPHRFVAFTDTEALPERSRGVARRPRGAETEVRSRGHQCLHRRHPAQHRRGIDDGGQPGLLRRRDRRPGERIVWHPASPAHRSSPTPT